MRKNLEETRQYFLADRFAVHTGITIDEVGDGFARCSMEIKDHHRNAHDTVMGGAVFTLADLCYGAACGGEAVSITSEINFLRPATGTKLTAEAPVVKDGRSTVFYEIKVFDDRSRVVAFATMTGYRVEKG